MLWIFRAITDRLKALFISDVAHDFEAELLTRDAERRAELLRQAQKYDREGLPEVARTLRERALASESQRPLALVLPAVEHLKEKDLSRKDRRLDHTDKHKHEGRRLRLTHNRKGR